MAQVTVKDVPAALRWLHENDHHVVGVEQPNETHVFYQNHFDKLRVPRDLAKQCGPYLRPNPRKFDTRMYALTPAGKRLIGVSVRSI